jgi:Transcriptional regulators
MLEPQGFEHLLSGLGQRLDGDGLALGSCDLLLQGRQVGHALTGVDTGLDGLVTDSTLRDQEASQPASGLLILDGDLILAGAGDQLRLEAELLQLLPCFLGQGVDPDRLLVRELHKGGLHCKEVRERPVDAFGLQQERDLGKHLPWEPLAFELAVAEMSGNSWLSEVELMLRDAWVALSAGLRETVGRHGEWLAEHRAILASMRSRNVAQAQRLVVAHLSLERFEDDLQSRGSRSARAGSKSRSRRR